jgi:predicted metal-dependent phosphoesterase TrpH
VENKLKTLAGAVETATTRYHQEVHAAWKAYGETYEQLAAVTQDAAAGLERRRANAKRKLAALQVVCPGLPHRLGVRHQLH